MHEDGQRELSRSLLSTLSFLSLSLQLYVQFSVCKSVVSLSRRHTLCAAWWFDDVNTAVDISGEALCLYCIIQSEDSSRRFSLVY